MCRVGEESVRGTIIGQVTFPYEFWTTGEWPGPIVKRSFENDRQAEAWFKEHYPTEYRAGAEMRCFDQGQEE